MTYDNVTENVKHKGINEKSDKRAFSAVHITVGRKEPLKIETRF